MAGVDKTYLSKEQYKVARQFWLDTYDEQVRLFGHAEWLYPFSHVGWGSCQEAYKKMKDGNTEDIDNFTNGDCLWNTSSEFDIWAYKRSNNADWLTHRTPEYDDLDFDFEDSSELISIEFNTGEYIHFLDEKNPYLKNGEEYIDVFKEMVIFGTTSILKDLYELTRLSKNFRYFNFPPDDLDFSINFFKWGVEFNYENSKLYAIDEDGNNGKTYDAFPIMQNLDVPKFIYSTDTNVANNYQPEQIIVSEPWVRTRGLKCITLDELGDPPDDWDNVMLVNRALFPYLRETFKTE